MAGENRSKAGKLFDNFVEVLNECVKPGDDGVASNPGAATLNVIRQFLKDQNIAADEDRHEGLKTLKEQTKKLPFDEAPGERDL